jgi:hypothetical protein
LTGYWNRSSVVVVIPYNPSGLEFGVPSAVLPVTTLIGVLDYNNDVATPPTTYNGLTVTAIESVKYFRMTANYTYSHTIDNGNFTTFYQPAAEPIRLRFGTRNSNQDLRHNLVTNFTATAPEHTFLRNFELSSIMSLQSGKSFTLFAGQNTFGDVAGVSTDRVGGAPVTGECTSVSNCSTTVGRNTYTGAPCISWDLRLSRNFTISEGKILDLSVDSFNLLLPSAELLPKHYNDATTLAIQQSASSVSCAPQQAIGNPGAWVADGLVPVTIPNFPNARFGRPRTVFNPRQLQFSLKFSF